VTTSAGSIVIVIMVMHARMLDLCAHSEPRHKPVGTQDRSASSPKAEGKRRTQVHCQTIWVVWSLLFAILHCPRQSTIMRYLFLVLSIAVATSVHGALDEPFTSSFSALKHAPCVSLFYRNGRLGCGTEEHSVQVGKLVYFRGNLPNTPFPYVALVDDFDLTEPSLNTLMYAKVGGFLKGILVLNSTKSNGEKNQNVFYSPASKTPLGDGSPSVDLNFGYTAYQWNSIGQGLTESDFYGVPMAFVPDSDVADSLRQGALSSTDHDSIYAELNYYMGPDNVTSLECLGWKDIVDNAWNPKCLPLAGTSVWATPGSPPQANEKNNRDLSSSSGKPVFMLAAGMDATSMFHDISPGANAAASNILTILMAAKLIGNAMSDSELDALPNRIVFALFQAETYGFTGSRNFLHDLAYPGFSCKTGLVRSVSKLGDKSDFGCLSPLRPSIRFADLGAIAGMLSIDQVGHAVADGILYVHADQNNDNYGNYLVNLLKYSSTGAFSVTKSSIADNGNGYPYPPSPLTSLLKLSEGAVGGAVLSGYDYSFTGKVSYHSVHDSANVFQFELETVAAAATIAARAALAVAYDDGTYSGQGDYSTPSKYAKNLIPELSSSDSTLVELANCFLYDGNCNLIAKYSAMEAANERSRTGNIVQSGSSLGTPPSYYVGPYSGSYGQPFVQVGDKVYGAYNGSDFGKKSSDAISMQPRQVEGAIHALFNDFLGRGSTSSTGSNSPLSCKKWADCVGVDYCLASGDTATCSGSGQCVCQRAHYHVALDEALLPAENMPTGYFVINDNDAGSSPIYTEPFWSPSVGVRVYREVGVLPGVITLASGLAVGATSLFGALMLKVGLKKEKLY
jgi:nicastrin